MKVSQAIDGYLLFKATRASKTTIETDKVLFKQFRKWLIKDPEVEEIESETIRDYLAYHRNRGLSPYTIRRHHATLSAFYSWLADEEVKIVEDNPVRAVPPPKLPKRVVETLSHSQIDILLNSCNRSHMPRRARALILFLLDSAARISEASRVQVSDVDLKSGRVKLLGKRDKERYVHIGRRARSAVWLYINEERPEPTRVTDDNLFLTNEGYPMCRHTLRHAIYRMGDWANVKVNPHLFRHTAAIERLRHGMDAFTLQRFLGHTTLEVTRLYLSALADEDVEVKAARTSPADNWKL